MFNGHKWWHKVARTGSYNDLNNLPTAYDLAKQLYNGKTINIQGTIDKNGRMYVSFPLFTVPKTYSVSKVLVSNVADLSSGFTVEGYDSGILISGLSSYINETCDAHVLLTY